MEFFAASLMTILRSVERNLSRAQFTTAQFMTLAIHDTLQFMTLAEVWQLSYAHRRLRSATERPSLAVPDEKSLPRDWPGVGEKIGD